MTDWHIIALTSAYTMIIQMKNSKIYMMMVKEIHIGRFGGNKVVFNPSF